MSAAMRVWADHDSLLDPSGRTLWQVRMINSKGELANHPGWVVTIPALVPAQHQPNAAMNRVLSLGLDIGPDGEYAGYELTVDVLEWSNAAKDVIELH